MAWCQSGTTTSLEGCVWHLDHYELFCSETNRDNFMLIGSDGDLALCIQGSQLLVIHNGWVAESVCLLTANHQVRGIWRQNSLLMLVRHQTYFRQFRVSFSSSLPPRHCAACVQILNRYLSVRHAQGFMVERNKRASDWFTTLLQQKSGRGLPDLRNVSAKFSLEDSLIVAFLNPELVQLSEEIAKLFKSYL